MMNSRSRKILNLVVSAENKELPKNANNMTQDEESFVVPSIEQDKLPNDCFSTWSDTNSIPDSEHGLSLSILEDGDEEDNNSITMKKCTKPEMPIRVIEESDDSSSLSDTDSSSLSDTQSSDSSSSSSSTNDFSSDDSVKDPNYKPDNNSDLEEETELRPFSPQPGPSGVRLNSLSSHQTAIMDHCHYIYRDSQFVSPTGIQSPVIDIEVPTVENQSHTTLVQPPSIHSQPPSINSQIPSIDNQPHSIDSQPPSIDSQPPSIDAQPASIVSEVLILNNGSRKRRANPNTWKRNRTKLLRNTGKAYSSSKSHKMINAKELGPACTDKCKLECSSKFTFQQRLAIFESYWQTGDLQVQRQFVHDNMTKIMPKYRYVRVGSTRQNPNHAYSLPLNNTRTRVCKQFFMNTLAISDKTIRTVIKKNSDPTGIPSIDNRGKHGNQNKVEATVKAGVKAHINSIPRIESHYCRARSKREFVEGSLSVAALHRDYVDKCKTDGKPFVSYQIYYNIFVNDFNISFWQPKKDQCEDCTAYKNSEDKTILQDKYDQHLKEKTLVRAEKEVDKQNINDNLIVCVYDLQAVMPCPQGEVSSFFYISKINLLNFTITELGTNNSHCFVWHEGEGARGVNEIGSCVLKYLTQLNDKATTDFDIIFYSDNCCGQQKNKFMLAMYQYAIKNLPRLRSITHKFLIKGHTQNEGDAVHSLIQRNISKALKSSPIYVPDQYITLIKTAKKKGTPFNVYELSHDSFWDLKPLAIGNYTLTEKGNKVKWSNIKVIKVHKDYDNNFMYKDSYEADEFNIVSTTKRSAKASTLINLKKLYNQKLKVQEKKKEGILKLIEKDIVPKYYKSFYESL